MEILGWYQVDSAVLTQLDNFISQTIVHDLTNAVAFKTIKLRQLYRVKLPDAIIASTALSIGAHLITHNVRDFQKINDLVVIDSHILGR
jgi:predicted nucleic acid-binding protein